MQVRTETLEKLRSSVRADVSEWAAMVDISAASYARSIDMPEVTLSEAALERLARSFEVTLEAILDDTLDYKLLAKRSSGHATALPEKYTHAAYSKVRTSAYLLDYVEMTYGWQARSRILQHFQMNESIMCDPDMKISIRFLADLCEYLELRGFTSAGFHEMGKFSSVSNARSSVAALLRKEGTPSRAYERCFTELIGKHYDQNNVYCLRSLGRYQCTVEARPHPKLLDESDGRFFSNASVCAAKGGGFASIMEYLGLPDASVTEVECIHRGDARCRYEIDFALAGRTHHERTRRALDRLTRKAL